MLPERCLGPLRGLWSKGVGLSIGQLVTQCPGLPPYLLSATSAKVRRRREQVAKREIALQCKW